MIILHFTVNSFFIRQQKLFFYLLFFLEKPDFLKIIFFPLLCLSCVLSLIRFSMNIGFQPITALAAFLHRLYSYTSSRLYPCKTYQMGSSGLEPPTSRLSGARSNLLSYEPPTGSDPFSHFLQLSRGVLTRSFALGCPWLSPILTCLFRFFGILCVLPYFAVCASPVKAIGFPFHFRDGDDGIRTHDPLLAGQVLSQLSYTPIGLSDLFSLSMSLSLTEN